MGTLTIGRLAKRAGIRASALRYYEEQGLIQPVERTSAGYRLYSPETEQTLQFIQRAQRLGLALTDIRQLLVGLQNNSLTKESILNMINGRYLTLERQVTEGLVLRHEMGQFLQELNQKAIQNEDLSAGMLFDQLLDHICSAPIPYPEPNLLSLLMEYADCRLTTEEGQNIINRLRNQHVHMWKEEDGYHILIVSKNPEIFNALEALTQLENHCDAHANSHPALQLQDTSEGYLLVVHGENAFMIARLFLSLAEAQ